MTTWRSCFIVLALAVMACGHAVSGAGDAVESTPPDAGVEPSDAARDPPSVPAAVPASSSNIDQAYRTAALSLDPAPSVGAPALTAIDSLPFLRLDEESRHASSYDRTGGNTDYDNAYDVDSKGDWIVLDARGPGCVYRIWFTGFTATAEIHAYFDDETVPRIDMPLADFFGGGRPPFTAPLVADAFVSSGGYFSYVPLPFAKSLRITVTPGWTTYYNIDFHALPADSVVSTWQGTEDLSAARAVWGAAGSDPKGDAQSTPHETTFDLAPGRTQVLYAGVGPAEVSSIELQLPGVLPPHLPSDGGVQSGTNGFGPGPDELDQLWVSMTWDDDVSPSVFAPIGSLFAIGDLGAGASGGLLAGVRSDGTFYLYFPMPFSKRAQIALINRGLLGASGLWSRVETKPFPYSFDQVGTFAARYSATASSNGADLTLLDTPGSGKVVGVVVSESRAVCSDCTLRDYLEGDERVLVDDARTPVVLGTGTEDFFNGGFYFFYGPFGLPSHGNVVHAAPASFDATSAYRFFLSDSISFRNHVRVSLEHGPIDNDAVHASSLIYYYRQDRSRLVLTDAFVVGDYAGEQRHRYELTNPTWSGAFEATFEGEFDKLPFASTGRAHNGTSSFVVQIDPANSGVVLRRLLNQGTGDQRAQVFANGSLVGDWFTSGRNASHSWREDDFAIPASLTAGKSSLSIEIRFVSSDVDWNEFEYQVFSQLP